MSQELGFKDFKEPFCWYEVLWRMNLKLIQKFIYGDFFDRRSLLTFFLWLFGFLLWRMNGIRNVVLIGIPYPGEEVIEGTDAGSITNPKAGKNGVQAILLSCEAQEVMEVTLNFMESR